MSIGSLPQSLDVILVRGSSTQSTWLCGLQSVAMLRSVSFSHAALSIGEGICLHATTKGVHLIRPSELWTSTNYRARKVVLRSKQIKTQVATNELLRQAHQFAREAFGARYNHFFGIPKRWIGVNGWFCSELAADALKRVGHDVVSNRNPEKIWPGHFQRCHEQSNEWDDVTGIYDAYVREITNGANTGCTDVFARTRYLTGEATFGLYKKAFSQMFDGDKILEDANAFDVTLRETTGEIIRVTNEIKKRMKK